LLTIEINTALNQGDKEALALADEVMAILRGWQGSGVFFRLAPFVRRVGAGSKWYVIEARMPFERDPLL